MPIDTTVGTVAFAVIVLTMLLVVALPFFYTAW